MKHLSDEQFAEWLAGEASPEAQEHVRGCELCSREAAGLRDQISRYALAVRRQAAGSESSRLVRKLTPARTLLFRRLRWAGAAALALLLAAQTGWMMRPHRSVPIPTQATNPAPQPPPPTMSDDELLEAVNNDLNRDVPRALAPVSALTIARNQIAASNSAASNRQGERE
jgi:hypothetical protein